MKIRNGFVSNSSSSSFIVTFPHKPENKEDLASMMGDCNTTHLTNEQVVSYVWSDVERKGNCNTTTILLGEDDTLEDSYYLERKVSEIISDLVYELPWEEREDASGERKVLEKLVEKLQIMLGQEESKGEDTFTVRLTYSDEDGMVGSQLEHGNIFRNVQHRRINQH